MAVPIKHVLSQGPVLRALGAVALSSLRPRAAAAPAIPATPGPWIETTLPPRPAELIRAYVRNVGGDPGWYRGVVPPHLFPQWGFGLAAKTLVGLPYPLARVMNAGCRLEIRAPLPAHEPLDVKVRLESIDDDGRRAILTQRIVTGTKSAPEAVLADLKAYVPLAKPNGANGGSRARERAGTRPSVPADAKEIAFLRLSPDAGLDFAKLTGDFNPIHWIPAYARAAGFKSCILHGFGTFARAIESLNRNVFAGDTRRLATIDARFVRPLVLPARVGVYVQSDRIWVGDAPNGGAYLEGSFTVHR